MNANHKYKNTLTLLDLFALSVTNRIGTISFFFLVIGCYILWVGWNYFAPSGLRFDPSPAFVLLLFISNFIQLALMPLIMVGQNLQSRHAEIRAEDEYNVSLKNEEYLKKILEILERK